MFLKRGEGALLLPIYYSFLSVNVDRRSLPLSSLEEHAARGWAKGIREEIKKKKKRNRPAEADSVLYFVEAILVVESSSALADHSWHFIFFLSLAGSQRGK